jgi:2-polyprenyl-3-methyl-5-hydroxy-6-metoxy-1,4-benzoquinol methylase
VVDLLPVWCCPLCGGALIIVRRDSRVSCARCTSGYDVVAGIPDLRVSRPAWVDFDADREAAMRLDRDARACSLEALVRLVFAEQPGRGTEQSDRRAREVLAAPDRLARDVREWLRDVALTPGFVDIGCGPGMLLAAAADRGIPAIGIDASLEWLVVARRMVETHGGRPVLCAALAEKLPPPDGAAPAIAALDVIEHVGDQHRFLRELDRVAAPGAPIALSTPNRFSLAAEPHVGVWGVGWLPAAWQRSYVQRRTGNAYRFVRLLSAPGFARMMRRDTHASGRLQVPRIPDEAIAAFTGRRRLLARAYNRAARVRWLRWPLLAVGPFFRYLGTKAPGDAARPRAHAFTTEVALPIPSARDEAPATAPRNGRGTPGRSEERPLRR